MDRKALWTRAETVLRENDRGIHTVPSPRLYPHQWAWDSAFIAIGLSHIDPKRGLLELQSLFSAQWTDGRVPHIRFDPKVKDYAPGPEFWGTESSSSISQPPVFAMALKRLVETGLEDPAIPGLIRAIDRAHLFFHQQRDPLGLGLVAVAHPWESGLDNSPAWDTPLGNVITTQGPTVKRKSAEVIVDPTQRPSDDEYARYEKIVAEITENGFGMGSFQVYDPMMTALLAKNELELCWLSEKYGIETEAGRRANRLTSSLTEHLWDSEKKRFVFLDAMTRKRLTPDILATYIPLLLDLPEEIADTLKQGLREKYWAEWPLPSVAPTSELFEARRYWRGPTWINMNWFLAPILGKELIKKTLELVDRNGFFEYFQPETGEGLGGESFSWTAALVLDLLAT